MVKEKAYVEVQIYNDRGDPLPPNNYRPELVVGKYRLMLDLRENIDDRNGCMPREKANLIAREIASALGIESKLKS